MEFEYKEPPFTKPKTPSIISIVGMALAFALNWVLWIVADWSSSLTQLLFQNITLISFGIVFPIIVLILSVVGSNNYQKSDYVVLFLGIAILVLSAIVLTYSLFWILKFISYFINNIEYAPFYLGILACIILTHIMQVKSLISGTKLIKHYQFTGPH